MIDKYLFSDNPIPFHSIRCTKKREILFAPVHMHDFYEIDIFVSGYGETVINQTKYCIKPGSVFLLTPADIHNYTMSQKATVMNISFNPDILEYSPFLEILYPLQYISAQLPDPTFQNLLNYVTIINDECEEKKQFGRKYISMILSCILIDLYRLNQHNPEIIEHSIPYYIPVQKALYYIRSNFKEKITLKSAADYANMSASNLSKKFSEYFNIGFNEYLTDLRLEYAKMLILNTSEKITDIAFYSGFNSLSYFQHSFTGKYGVTPKSLRKTTN